MFLAIKVVGCGVGVPAVPVALDRADVLEVLAEGLQFRWDGSHGKETVCPVRVEVGEEVVVEDKGQDNKDNENGSCARFFFSQSVTITERKSLI